MHSAGSVGESEVRVIVIIGSGWFEVLREGETEAMDIKGFKNKIPNNGENWQRLLDNLNEAPENIRLKRLWERTDPESLRRCLEVFGWKMASLDIETADLRGVSDSDILSHFDAVFDRDKAADALARENRLFRGRCRKLQDEVRSMELGYGRV